MENQSAQGAEAVEPDSDGMGAKPRRGKQNLLAGVLGPALKLWLRSQVETVEHLEVAIGSEIGDREIGGSDGGGRGPLSSRQMLAGRIPLVRVEARSVIYQGLHLGQLKLVGQDIRMNLGQAVRGKPLKLLAPIGVALALKMTEAQLNDSLASPLLAPQLGEWLNALQALLVEADQGGAEPWTQPRIALAGGALGSGLAAERLGLRVWHRPRSTASGDGSTLMADMAEVQRGTELAIETALGISNGNLLQLHQPRWSEAPPAGFQADLSCLAMMPLQLGRDVAIEQIAIAAGQLHLKGQLTIQP